MSLVFGVCIVKVYLGQDERYDNGKKLKKIEGIIALHKVQFWLYDSQVLVLIPVEVVDICFTVR